jgi:HrpA-like RNA helicase
MIRTQLLDLITSSTELFGTISISTCYNDTEKLSKTLAAGAYLHAAKRVQQLGGGQGTRPLYRTVRDNREAMIHPHSVLYTRTPHPNWIVYGEIVTTSKTYLRTVSRIEPEWLLQYASSWFKVRGNG